MATNAERVIRAFLNTPWAIREEKLFQIFEVLELRARGVKLSDEEVRARIGAAQPKKAANAGGVAVLPLFGTIAQKMNLFLQISGGTSTEQFGAAFDRALKDPDIGAIVIEADSPGGSVYGVDELSRKIYDARGQKRIVAVANPMAASAAYYIASAADEVVVTPSGEVGSIGVFAVHTELSRYYEALGVTDTVIRYGENKALANPYEPLSEEARVLLEENVTAYGELFDEAVARNRGVSMEEVRAEFGQGKMFTARAAVDAELADRVATLDEVLEELGVSPEQLREARAAAESAPKVMVQVEETTSSRPLAAPEPLMDVGLLEYVKLDALDEAERAVAGVAEETSPESDDHEDHQPDATADATGDDESAEHAPEGEEDVMGKDPNEPQKTGAEAPATPAAVIDEPVPTNDDRAAKIVEMCNLHGMPEKASTFIREGKSAEQVAMDILDGKVTATRPVRPDPKAKVELSEEEDRQYSILRAMRGAVTGDWGKAGFEKEVSDEISRKLNGKSLKDSDGLGFENFLSFYVPTSLGVQADKRAALTAGGSTSGAELVFTEPGSFIDLLRTRLVTAAMGATFLPGLEGNVAFPRQTSAGTFAWRAENPGSDVSLTDLATDQVELSPNDGSSATSFSRRLLAQSNINVEQLVRRDLAAIAARGIDLAALHGGGGNEPTGLYTVNGLNSVAMGGAISWSKVVQLETEVRADDADIGTMAYVTTPNVRGAAKTTEKASNTAQFLWTGGVEDGEMNGFRAFASNQVSKTLGSGSDEHGILFGVWDQLLIGEWGAMEILVDPYTLARQALIVVILNVIADVQVRHEEAFCKGTGLTVS